MSGTIIRVQNISKRYRLGLKEKQAETLSGQIGNLIKSPWENLKRLREMSRFGVEDESAFWALKDINFEVKQGEVLGIIGKNGAGKSTLLKILSQITEPTSGKIEIHGRVASLLEVGTGFHPELSGRENIFMNGTILGMTRREIEFKLDEIIDFSGVEKFIDSPVKFYSSGMKVRLGFSVAAHLDPEVLIIDEVLAVGDFDFQQKCLKKINDISSRKGQTIVFVSHDLGAISKICSSCLLLENGGIIMADSSENCVKKYLKGDIKELLNPHTFDNIVDNDFRWNNIVFEQNNFPSFDFFSDQSIIIKIDFTIYSKLIGLRVYIDVYDFDENLISKNFFDEMSPYGSVYEKGNYQTNALIPENILIEGEYFVTIRAGVHNERNINPIEGIKFKIFIKESGTFQRLRFKKSERGMFVLPIKWSNR